MQAEYKTQTTDSYVHIGNSKLHEIPTKIA